MSKYYIYSLFIFSLCIIMLIIELEILSGSTREYQNPAYKEDEYQHPAYMSEFRNMSKNANFLYLVQTEQCLPQKLLENSYMGNTTSCNCEVLVLSYKQRCNRNSSGHISYTLNTSISWTVGRNILYRLSQALDKQYLYYIFLDDDVEFWYNKQCVPDDVRNMPPLRAFERFLLRYEPAVGVPNFQAHHTGEELLEYRRKRCPSINDTCEHVPVTHFDAVFNAFHRDALNYLLPYSSKYDHRSWWHSQRSVIVAAELAFRGHVWIYTPVLVQGAQHRPYPRYDPDMNSVWRDFVNNIAETLPIYYQTSEIVLNLKKDPIYHTERSLSPCFHLEARHPIVPYEHFNVTMNH